MITSLQFHLFSRGVVNLHTHACSTSQNDCSSSVARHARVTAPAKSYDPRTPTTEQTAARPEVERSFFRRTQSRGSLSTSPAIRGGGGLLVATGSRFFGLSFPMSSSLLPKPAPAHRERGAQGQTAAGSVRCLGRPRDLHQLTFCVCPKVIIRGLVTGGKNNCAISLVSGDLWRDREKKTC